MSSKCLYVAEKLPVPLRLSDNLTFLACITKRQLQECIQTVWSRNRPRHDSPTSAELWCVNRPGHRAALLPATTSKLPWCMGPALCRSRFGASSRAEWFPAERVLDTRRLLIVALAPKNTSPRFSATKETGGANRPLLALAQTPSRDRTLMHILKTQAYMINWPVSF